jgi:hypothetical protein
MFAVRAAWRIMQQPLTEQTTTQAPRPTRRRLAKAGLPTGEVKIIHVRSRPRRSSAPADQTAGRTYQCRWPVRGHWRAYWCGPGRNRQEDRWINSYIAGPNDKPIRSLERVQVWDQ